MNRRQLLKSVIGVAVATAVPSMPFVWRESQYQALADAFWRQDTPDWMPINQGIVDLMNQVWQEQSKADLIRPVLME